MTLIRLAVAGTTITLLGLVQLGCSNGSGRSGRSVATAATAAASSGSSTTVTSAAGPGAAPPGTPPVPTAPASQGQPLNAFNAELQTLWDKMLPHLLGELTNTAQTQLQNARYASGNVSVELRNARVGPRTAMAVAPGFLRMDTQKLHLRAPVQGTWTLALDADVRVQVTVGGFGVPIDVPVTLRLEDLTIEVESDLDDSDPTRPVLQRIGQPQIQFNLVIDSSNQLVSGLTGVLSRPANWLAQQAVTLGLAQLMPSLTGLQGVPGPIPGDGAPPLTDSGVNTPFEEVANNVSVKVRQVNAPHGLVMVAEMDTPVTDSWLEAYRNGGPGVQGQVVDYGDSRDAAIWTGHTLAAEAYRYHVTGSALALDNVGHLLGGIGKLLDVNGATGLLARNAAPESSIAGRNIIRRGMFRSAVINGQRWVGRQGDNGISRDQYAGALFGLSITWELVPPARLECERRIKMILDYLIARSWTVDEDRTVWSPSTPNNTSNGPTFWAGAVYQKLTFLLIAHRVDPARYANALARVGPLSKSAWFGLWANTFGMGQYYGFNLAHINLYNYFRLETDPSRWQDMRRAYAMVERYVGHHRNPHFDLIQTSIDPATTAALFPSIREAMRQFVGINHREVAPAVIDLSGITFQTFPQYGYQVTGTGTISVGASTATFPTEPLPMKLRKPASSFSWQRDPFTPATPNQGYPHNEKVGHDLLLPYWMGRGMGAF